MKLDPWSLNPHIPNWELHNPDLKEALPVKKTERIKTETYLTYHI